jgi:CheY-like chemotaxis protein
MPPKTRDVPVLLMTALNAAADKVKAFAAGGADANTKPIEHDEALGGCAPILFCAGSSASSRSRSR